MSKQSKKIKMSEVSSAWTGWFRFAVGDEVDTVLLTDDNGLALRMSRKRFLKQLAKTLDLVIQESVDPEDTGYYTDE